MTSSELNAVRTRAAALDDCLQPFDPVSEAGRVAEAVAMMFNSFTSARDTNENALARVKAMMETLAGYPAWAIEKACKQVRAKGYKITTANGIKLEQTFPPSESIMFSLVGAEVELRSKTADSLRRLLSAEVEPVPEDLPMTQEQLDRQMADFRRRMVPSGAVTSEEQERQERAARTKATRARDLEDRRREYIDAGLEPPPRQAVGDDTFVIPSLSFLLANGWRIEEFPDGSRKLTASGYRAQTSAIPTKATP